jgi:hypothetical protein
VVSKKIVGRKNVGIFTTTNMSAELRRKITAYLTEMGVSTELIDPISKTAATDILRLNQYELLAMKLITGLDQVDALTSPSICKKQPVPANCREIPGDQYKATTGKPAGIKTADAKPAVAENDAKQINAKQRPT